MIGERIKKLREQHNLTQEKLAEKIGINMNTLASYEREIREPKIETIMRFASYFGVTADYLLGITPYPSLGAQEQGNANLRLLCIERKGQVEELEKHLVDCWLSHNDNLRFFPLWYGWLIKYLIDSVEVFDRLVEIEKELPITGISSDTFELISLAYSFSTSLSENHREMMKDIDLQQIYSAGESNAEK